MLGEEPTLRKYQFTKIAKATGFHIGNTAKFFLILGLPKGKWEEGQTYRFSVERKDSEKEGQKLFVRCFAMNGRELGKAVVPLIGGSVNQSLTLTMKEKKSRQ